MKQIVCKYDMFDLYQSIFLIDENGVQQIGSSNTENLADTIVSYCNQYNIFNVHLFGNAESLLNIQNSIINTNFSHNSIEVEVN